MGLFDFISKLTESKPETSSKPAIKSIELAASTHIVKNEEYGDEDSEYMVSIEICDSFLSDDSGAGEVVFYCPYAPDGELPEGVSDIYIAILSGNEVYGAVNEFKEKGDFQGSINLKKYDGKYYFSAKKEYAGNMMYFYGMDRLDGFWENNGLCIIYPKKYVGTTDEEKLMSVLDKVAASYTEKRIK